MADDDPKPCPECGYTEPHRPITPEFAEHHATMSVVCSNCYTMFEKPARDGA